MNDNPAERPVPVSPDWARGLVLPRMSRRSLLQAGGGSALAMALAACGVSGTKKTGGGGSASTAGSSAAPSFWQEQKKTGSFNFASWPLYMDVNPSNKNDHPSLDEFTKQTGIKVNYTEVIQDDGPFFGKVRPQLAAGEYCGYDLAIITSGIYLGELIDLGYLIPLDQSKMTNFRANASRVVQNPSFDPGNKYSMAWQSGITGIAYDPKRVGRKITSWNDLLDPKFKGKVGMFADNQDLPNSALCAIGVDPSKSTEADWKKAADWLKRGKPLVRQYYNQDYIKPLSTGDIWISMAWSGDIFQANASGANLEFVVPKEGAPIWTDNMCILKYSKHPVDAMTYMDWVYQPSVAAMLAEYINYITPVPGAKAVISSDAKKASAADKASLESLVNSPLIFPPATELSRLHYYRKLSQSEQDTWNGIFEPIYQS